MDIKRGGGGLFADIEKQNVSYEKYIFPELYMKDKPFNPELDPFMEELRQRVREIAERHYQALYYQALTSLVEAQRTNRVQAAELPVYRRRYR